MLLKCRKCRQREVAFDGIKGLCPSCQQESDLSKPPHRRGRNDKAVLLIQSRVSPGRVSMTAPLLVLAGAAVAAVAVESVRFSAERTRAHQWAQVAQGGGLDRQALHDALQTINTTNLLRFATFMGVLIAYQRWARIGHANAMSRSDIGLGWLRTLPGSRGIVTASTLWFFSVFAALYVGFIIGSNNSTDPSTYETAANVDSVYSAVRILLAVMLTGFCLQLTLGLNKLLATPEPVAVPVTAPVAVPLVAPVTAPVAVPLVAPAATPDAAPAPSATDVVG